MGTILLITFASPFYFLMRRKWGGFCINAILYILAFLLLFIGVGILFWAIAVLHASIAYGKEREEKAWQRQQRMMDEQATATAQRMAAAIQQQQQQPKQDLPPPEV